MKRLRRMRSIAAAWRRVNPQLRSCHALWLIAIQMWLGISVAWLALDAARYFASTDVAALWDWFVYQTNP